MSSALYALWNYSIDLDIAKLKDFFEHPLSAYRNILSLRNELITILEQEGMWYTAEKIPVYDIVYTIDFKNQLILTISSKNKKDTLSSFSKDIWVVKISWKDELLKVLSGNIDPEKYTLPKWTGCYIISDIVSQFSHLVVDPYNRGDKDIKIVPNLSFKNKDNTISNGMLRIGRPIQWVEHFPTILQGIINDTDQVKDVLLTGNEFLPDFIYNNIHDIIENKWDHRLFIVPTRSIIENQHLLEDCYQNAFLLTMNSIELTHFNKPSWEIISKKHKELINGYEWDYIRMITNESEWAVLFLQENGVKYETHMDILDENIGKELIEMIYTLWDKETLKQYISRDIAQGVGAWDTAAAGLIAAHYNIEKWEIRLDEGDEKILENLKIKARYYLSFSQILSFLTYHSVFSNFTQLREIIWDDEFNQVIEQINELVKIQMDPTI